MSALCLFVSTLLSYIIVTWYFHFHNIVTAEVGNVRVSKERRISQNSTRRLSKEDDQREGRVTVRASTRVRRDRVVPLLNNMTVDKPEDGKRLATRRRSSKGNDQQLVVKTDVDFNDDVDSSTPRTEASTPSPTSKIRGDSDLRSPGQRMSPKAIAPKLSALDVPLPDFITQTDKDGNAVSPRSESAIQQARVEHPSGAKPKLHLDKNGKLTEQSDGIVDACAETFLDSIRIMCCCLLPEETSTAERSNSTQLEESKPQADALVERPSLLPKLHVNDHGKKCLVLDLDETLVHSSFRAVPGADFVIPVQVRTIVLALLPCQVSSGLLYISLTMFPCFID